MGSILDLRFSGHPCAVLSPLQLRNEDEAGAVRDDAEVGAALDGKAQFFAVGEVVGEFSLPLLNFDAREARLGVKGLFIEGADGDHAEAADGVVVEESRGSVGSELGNAGFGICPPHRVWKGARVEVTPDFDLKRVDGSGIGIPQSQREEFVRMDLLGLSLWSDGGADDRTEDPLVIDTEALQRSHVLSGLWIIPPFIVPVHDEGSLVVRMYAQIGIERWYQEAQLFPPQ